MGEENPVAMVSNNVVGTMRMLEAAGLNGVANLSNLDGQGG